MCQTPKQNTIKVTVHLERCFQFSVCNSVNTHRTATNLYINGKLMQLSKWWCEDSLKYFVLQTNASITVQTVYFTSRRQCGSQFRFQLFLACLWVLAQFSLLFRPGDFIDFLQAFEENSLSSAYKIPINWSGISKFPRTVYIFSYYFMRLKMEGTLILCIVAAVLAKTSLEKFASKLRRTSYNFTSGKNSRSSCLANY